MRILVVDDEPALRQAVKRALGFEGYEVTFATDGVEALEVSPASASTPSCSTSACRAWDGLEVCRRLRRSGDMTPVLMLTARSPVEARVEGLDAGADDYLPKPFALQELLARLRSLLRRSAATGTSSSSTRTSRSTPRLARSGVAIVISSSRERSSCSSSCSSATRAAC